METGLGISIVTDICLEDADKLAKIPVKEYFPVRSYGVVIRRGKFIPAQAKRFIEMLAPDYFHRAGSNAELSSRSVNETLGVDGVDAVLD